MIFTLYVAVDLVIAFFTLAVGSYTALKAYRVSERGKEESLASDQRYELEKDYYLVSTVGWMTLATRIIAIPLFYATVVSLIPLVPGAMCEFGVLQAGSPFSWANFGVKLVTLFLFGGWLFYDFLNRKLKNAPFIVSLSSGFVLLVPLFFIDALLDIAFFGTLQSVVVPCCMVVYSINSLLGGCPFCLITFDMPLLMGVIIAYAIAVALMIWTFLAKRSLRARAQKENVSFLSKTLLTSFTLALIGTAFLIIQLLIGPV